MLFIKKATDTIFSKSVLFLFVKSVFNSVYQNPGHKFVVGYKMNSNEMKDTYLYAFIIFYILICFFL